MMHFHLARVLISSLPFACSASLKRGESRGNVYFGTAVDHNLLEQGGKYKDTILANFNVMTPGNEMKFDAIEPNQGQFTFEAADKIIEFAQQNNMKVRGQAICWAEQNPRWIQNLNAEETKAALENHIKKFLEHFGDKIFALDVVNEVMDFSGNYDAGSIWYQKLGDKYPEIAFTAARQANTKVKLYANDYNVEGKNAKSDGFYKMVQGLKAKGLIDGVGFQTHLKLGAVPQDMETNLKRFSDLGLNIAITEIDVAIRLPVTDGALKQQEEDFAKVTSYCLANVQCQGVTVWGVTFSDSWIGKTPATQGEGAAVLFDENFNPTPAFKRVMDILGRKQGGSS